MSIYTATLGSVTPAQSGVSPISLVVATSASADNATPVITSGVNTTGATGIVLAASYYLPNAPGAVMDSKSNIWTPLTPITNAVNEVQLFWCPNPTTGSGHTFTLTTGTSSTGGSLAMASFALTKNVGVDQENGAGADSGATQQPGSITPSEANCVVVSAIGYYNLADATAPLINSGFTVATNSANSSGLSVGLAYKVQTSAVAVNPTWTTVGILGNVAVIADFKHA